jgi:hypothetical protein
MPIDKRPNEPQRQYEVTNVVGRNMPTHPIYIGEVMSVEDVQVLQRVYVYIPELGGQQKDEDIIAYKEDRRNWILAQIGSPLLAATNRADTKKGDVYDNTQKSYGIFLPIPDINVTVIVAFPGGSIDQATIIGTIGPENRTFTLPGIPWTPTVDGDGPGAEKNWRTPGWDHEQRPMHTPMMDHLIKQGIDLDGIRGTSTSGTHRAYPYPTKAYGITTPAQHHFVMDDGHSEPPAGENKQWWNPQPGYPGDHNSLIRLRTAGGGQILFHDTEKLIYIITPDGETWIEMSDNEGDGKIDVYSSGDISVNSEKSINFRAGDRISLEAVNEIDIKSLGAGGVKVEALTGSIELAAGGNYNVTADGNGNILIAGDYKETAQRIDMNGPRAAEAEVPEIFILPCNKDVKESIANRVPEHEPWDCHFIEEPTLVYPYKGLSDEPDDIDPEAPVDGAPPIVPDKPS